MLRTTNSSINEICLSGNQQINDSCMKSVGEYIKSNKYIEGIWLGENNISDVGIEILAPYLDGNTTFKGFYLNFNKGITDKSIPFLVKMIESSHIVDMGINNTSITQINTLAMPLACNTFNHGSTRLDLSFK